MYNAARIACTFVEARKAWTLVDTYPGDPPPSLTAAYAIQDEALRLWQREIGGWKVGKINPPASEELGANRLTGPIFRDLLRYETGEPATFPVFEGAFAAVEAEFMLRLRILDETLPETPQEAAQWVDEVRIGIEIASSPYSGINTDGPCVTISDHGNNAGVLLGAKVPQTMWASLDTVGVTLQIEGETVGAATTADMLDGPFGAVCFLLRNLRDREIPPISGWWVSTGAITGVHEIEAGQKAQAIFESLGDVEVLVGR